MPYFVSIKLPKYGGERGYRTHLCTSNRSRRDDIRGHTQWTKLERHSVGQCIDTRLGCRNVSLEGGRSVVQSSTDEDNPATSSSRIRLH